MTCPRDVELLNPETHIATLEKRQARDVPDDRPAARLLAGARENKSPDQPLG